MYKRIAVIGARTTPVEELKNFVNVIDNEDVIVTSGNAYGADQFSKYWKKNIQYLPWRGYNSELGYGYQSMVAGDITTYDNVIFELFPWIRKCKPGLLKLIRRNMCMISGVDGKHPVEAVYYWAEETNGKVKGGTAYAVEYARHLGIPTYNVKNMKCKQCGTVVEEEYMFEGMCPRCAQLWDTRYY